MPVARHDSLRFQTNVGTGTTPNGTIMDVNGYAFVVAQIVGLNTGTVRFDATLAQESTPATTTWVNIRVTPLNTGTVATTATADGLFYVDVRGLAYLRVWPITLSIVNDGRLDIYGLKQTEVS